MSKGIEKKLDNAWSLAVKIRDNFECRYCRKFKPLNSHHIFTRKNRSVRWDLNNGITLCVGCHTFSSKFSAHGTPVEFTYWLEEKKGKAWVDNLRFKAHQMVKWSQVDKELILIVLNEYIEQNK